MSQKVPSKAKILNLYSNLLSFSNEIDNNERIPSSKIPKNYICTKNVDTKKGKFTANSLIEDSNKDDISLTAKNLQEKTDNSNKDDISLTAKNLQEKTDNSNKDDISLIDKLITEKYLKYKRSNLINPDKKKKKDDPSIISVKKFREKLLKNNTLRTNTDTNNNLDNMDGVTDDGWEFHKIKNVEAHISFMSRNDNINDYTYIDTYKNKRKKIN